MKNFLKLYHDIYSRGITVAPRGEGCVEIEDYQIDVTSPFTSFRARRFSLNYLKHEFMWYLKHDPKDSAIIDHAKMWTNLMQPDGTFFSNYGQYWFGPVFNGFDWVIEELRRDNDSRRAVIPMLRDYHLFGNNKDVVCTEAISFRIREGRLNMSVHMRSNDAVWGTTNDVACFWFLREMIAVKLGIGVGTYRHTVDSMHVYERHFCMLRMLVDEGAEGFIHVTYPKIDDPDDLIRGEFRSDFGKWLTNQ